MYSKTTRDRNMANQWPAAWLHTAASILMASGLVHLVVWAVYGGPWDGPLAWRKPILFGISSGLTCWSAARVVSSLPAGRSLAAVGSGLAISLVLEVGLITAQTWRGVPSHFNQSTPVDAAIEQAMLVLIAAATLSLVELTRRAFGAIAMRPAQALAYRAGLVFLLVSCAIGFVNTGFGLTRVAANLNPDTFGPAGVMKFPHGAVIHALQWLPAGVWILWWRGAPDQTQSSWAWWAIGGSTLLLAFSMLQTYQGRARADFTLLSAIVLAAAVACVVIPFVIAAFVGNRRENEYQLNQHSPEIKSR